MKKKIGITAAVILGILAVCYIGFAVFFQSHFCFGTTIDGIKVGGCSTVKVEQLIEEEIGGYELTLVEREDQTETITASQIGAAPVFHGEIEELLADQNAFTWPAILFGKSALELEKRLPLTTQSFPGRSKRFPACRRRIRESRWMRPAPAIPQRTAIRLSRRITERRSMRQR